MEEAILSGYKEDKYMISKFGELKIRICPISYSFLVYFLPLNKMKNNTINYK